MFSADTENLDYLQGEQKMLFLLVVAWFAMIFVIIFVWCIIARKFEHIATLKGHKPEQAHAFAMVLLLGIIGMIYVLALPDFSRDKQINKIISLLSKKTDTQNS